MPIRNILVVIEPGSAIETVLDGALTIARRMEGHLKVLLLQPDPDDFGADYATVMTEPFEATRSKTAENTTIARKRFEAWRTLNELPGAMVDRMLHSTYAEWHSWEDQPAVGLVRYGRLADLIVMAVPRHRVGLSATLIDTALFDTGRPVLLLAHPMVIPPLERVAIAWNSSLQAVRCLAMAGPFLHEATHADVFAVTRPGTPDRADPAFIPAPEVVEALTWQGVLATSVPVHPEGDESIGAALLREAEIREIGLLILGAYTNSRVQDSMLGDVTRYVLDHAQIPLLMMH